MSHLGVVDLDQITFDKIVTCVNALKIKVDLDMLFDELIILQSTYKDLKQYRETLFEQVRVFINPKPTEEIIDDDNRRFFHKENKENMYIRPDWFWSYMFFSKRMADANIFSN